MSGSRHLPRAVWQEIYPLRVEAKTAKAAAKSVEPRTPPKAGPLMLQIGRMHGSESLIGHFSKTFIKIFTGNKVTFFIHNLHNLFSLHVTLQM